MPELLDPARHLALNFGWPVVFLKPRSKEPYTAHGVKDATTDERVILELCERYPDANLGVACGAPGPDVLDIDNPKEAARILPVVRKVHPPVSATFKGSHMFFAGTDGGTIVLPYGEVRRRGSYVVVPPSIHPSGKEYVWLDRPRKPLPQLPDEIIGDRRTAGAGELVLPDLIPKGQRHEALKELALRMVRSGVTDAPTIITALKAFYEERCVKQPPARANEFTSIAEWAANTDIARRERLTEDDVPMPAKKGKRKSKLGKPPDGDAPLAEHREFVKAAAGLPAPVNVASVARSGSRTADSLEITLSNGQHIYFDRQERITTRGAWGRTVVMCTSGIADPPKTTEDEMLRVFRSLCIIADPPPDRSEADEVRDALSDYVRAADVVYHQDLSTWHGRYEAIRMCHARPEYDPRNPEREPIVLVDLQGQRYIRNGEIRRWLTVSGMGITPGAVNGRLRMAGAEPVKLDGREDRTAPQTTRRTNRMLLYRLPEDL